MEMVPLTVQYSGISVSESPVKPNGEAVLESESDESGAIESSLQEGVEDGVESIAEPSAASVEDVVVAGESSLASEGSSLEDEINTEPELSSSMDDGAEVVQSSEGMRPLFPLEMPWDLWTMVALILNQKL